MRGVEIHVVRTDERNLSSAIRNFCPRVSEWAREVGHNMPKMLDWQNAFL